VVVARVRHLGDVTGTRRTEGREPADEPERLPHDRLTREATMHVRAGNRKRCAVVGAAAAALVVLAAGPAAAHVEVVPESAPKGGSAILSFSVPNERDDASTTQLQVQFPQDHPIPSVSVQTKPGWTIAVEKKQLSKPVQTEDGEVSEVVSTITWSGGEIKPGEFDLFTISAGPLPTKGSHLEFKALQTYSDGQVVRWIEERQKGAPEPEHPAPELELTKAKGGQGH